MAVAGLQPLTDADIDAVVALEERIYATPWSAQVFRDELAAAGRTYVKTVGNDGTLVGYGGLMVIDGEAHITTVVVDPSHRGAGTGTRLVLHLVRQALAAGARSLTLEVRVSNAAAQALYRRFGMAPVGVRKRYYIEEDALIMWVHDIDTPSYAARLTAIATELG